MLCRNLPGAREVRVAHADELRAVDRREQPRMMLAQVTDADDANADHAADPPPRDPSVGGIRPTIVIPASFAAAMIASPSIISALPASTDSALAPATRIAVIVATPTTGTSKRMTCFGLATLITRTPGPARCPAR